MLLGHFHRRRGSQSGYLLMVLLFMMALLVIAALASAPAVKEQIQHDREEEMIHRGAQYARAIKRYFKKFGRYPSSFDQLENTNNIRFLRKRYSDPMTADGKWKPLHIGDVKLGGSSNVGTPVSAMGTLGGTPNLGTPASGIGTAPGGNIAQPGPGSAPAASGSAGAGSSSTASSSAASSFSLGSSQIMGAPIIGVVSGNEKEGLHQFNNKTHYNEWYFFYDPTTDRGGLITGPYTGKTFGTVSGVGTPAGALGGATGQPGSFGQPSAFQPSTFGQQPAGPGQSPNQPQSPNPH